MARWLGCLGFAAACVATALTTAAASASAPPAPPDCGTPTTASLTNGTPAPVANTAVATSTIVASGLPEQLGDVDVITDLAHTSSSDIDMTLTSPAGTVVTLTTDNGGSLDNVFAGTRWDDDAAPLGEATATFASTPGHVQIHNYTNNVTATPLAPEEALGAFIGENPNGTWTLTVSDDAAAANGTLNSWGLDLQFVGAPPLLGTASEFANNTPVTIATAGTSLTTTTIPVSGLEPSLGDIDVVTDIEHSFSGDIQMSLTSPAGTSVFLTTGIFPGNPDLDDIYTGTRWDDSANPAGQVPYVTNAGLAADHPFANSVVATELAPIEGLSAFRGENPNGTWTLKVADQFTGDGGTQRSWALSIRGAKCVPPDTTIDSGPDEGATVRSAEASFTWSGDTPANVDQFVCSLDGAAPARCAGGRRLTGLSDGAHTFSVAAVNGVGLTDPTPATRTWTVDTTPLPAAPEPPTVPGPPPSGAQPPSTPLPPVTPAVVTAPVVGSFVFSPRKPKVGKTITLRWRLSKAGSVTVMVEKLNRRRRFAAFGSPITQPARAGAGSLQLKGKVGRKKLTAGGYRATIAATAPGATKASAAKTVRFTITK